MPLLAKFAAAIAAAGAVLAAAVAALSLPAGMLSDVSSGDPPDIELGVLAQRSYLYASDNSVMATLHEDENRQPVRLADIPQHLKDAVIAVEDAGFYVHDGVNARGILRAFAANVDAGGISQGGSTITQQLVKLSVVGSEQTLERKAQEFVLALRLEREMTKDEILSRYLNTVYFGNGAYGVQAASETYFGKSVTQLNVGEAALLAGIIRNPNSTNPVRSQERAQERRELALDRMHDQGLITAEEVRWWNATPLPDRAHQVVPPANDYFAEEVKLQLLRDPKYGLGETEEARYDAVFNGGLKVYTTFDPQAQAQAIAARDENLPLVNGVFAAGTDPASGEPRFGSAAIAAIQPDNGAVRAIVGGPPFEEDNRFNLATQNRRNPGSSFKTFVLTALMEQGRSPEDIVSGLSPCRFSNPTGRPNPYEPENFGGSAGEVGTVRTQTLRSSNCAYVRLGQIAGIQSVIDTARRMGLNSDIPNQLSTPLGVGSFTPLEMASAYATLANDGVFNPPYYVERIVDRRGQTIYQHQPTPEQRISPEASRLVSSVLQDNIRSGTAGSARIRSGHPAAAKTGTHQGSYDAWMVGYSRQLATAVWVGGLGSQFTINLDGAGITGGAHPGRIWGDFMTAYHEGKPVVGFPAPPGRPGGALLTVPGGVDLTPLPPPPPPGFPGFPGPTPITLPGFPVQPQLRQQPVGNQGGQAGNQDPAVQPAAGEAATGPPGQR